MFKIDRRILAHFDFLTIILIIPLIFVSGFLIGEIHPILEKKHTVYLIVGLFVFLIFFLIPLRRFIWLVPFAYWMNIALLVAVEFFGHARLGAKRWIELPFIHFTIQPSELMKPAFIVMLAYLINKNPPPEGGYDIKRFSYISLYILLPFILILKEPDLGTALVLLLVGYGVLFLIGVHWKIWLGIFIALAVTAPFLYSNLHDYQKQRVNDFLSEKPSYHVQQSIIAIGSGGVFGKIKEEATQTQMKFLPIASSDFIFAYVVERFGFVGAFFLITIYAVLILHLLSLSMIHKDYFIRVVSMSLSLIIFIYMSVNIAMTMGYAPVVGLPLPLFSYGGSSFINFIIMFAIMENLLSFRFKDMYDTRGTKSFV